MIIERKNTPNKSSRNGKKPLVIVLHSTGGSYAGAISWLCNPESKVSAHYVIAKDGRITQLCDTSEATWHAGKSRWNLHKDINDISIGVELEHWDNVSRWTDEQINSCAYIVSLLMDKWNIPEQNIVGHKDICYPRGRKIDPAGFPMSKLKEML